MDLALRSLWRRPGTTITAVGILSAGFGLAATIFSLGDPFLWRPLPYRESDRLVAIRLNVGLVGTQDGIPTVDEWQARTDLFDGLASLADRGLLRVRLHDRTVLLRTVAVTGNLFSVLDLTSSPGDVGDMWVSSRAVPSVLQNDVSPGRVVSILPAESAQVKAILPNSFLLPEPNRSLGVDALLVERPGPIASIDRSHGPTTVEAKRLVGRMRSGMTPEVIENALNATLSSTGLRAAVTLLPEAMKTRLRSLAAGALFCGVLVLAVCCMNVTSIILTRGLYRAQELLTLEVLGATRVQIVRSLMTEVAAIVTMGVMGAMGFVVVALSGIVAVVPTSYTVLGAPSVTFRTFIFIVVAGAVACACMGAAAIVAWRVVAKTGHYRLASREGRSLRTTRFCLLAGQAAAASLFVVGAVLCGRSYLNIIRTDSGFDGRAYTLTVLYPPWTSSTELHDTVQNTITALRRTPGITAAAAGVGGLLNGGAGIGTVIVNGRPAAVQVGQISQGYFRASGMRLVAGREPSREDEATGVVINEAFARQYFAGRAPIGQSVLRSTVVSVIGVVNDARSSAWSEAARPAIFELATKWQSDVPVTYVFAFSDRVAPSTDWERIIQGVHTDATVTDSGSLRERLRRSIHDRSFAALALGLFAIATTIVTGGGITGMVAYGVARRTREVGIRLALGATPISVVWLIARDSAVASVVGLLAGSILGMWLSRAMAGLLYGIAPGDPATFLATGVILFALVMAATVIPALGAARLQPTVALRVD
jgi:putative ABC transport system permease protein